MPPKRFSLRHATATRRANVALERIAAAVDGDPVTAVVAAGLLEQMAALLEAGPGHWTFAVSEPARIRLDYDAVERARTLRAQDAFADRTDLERLTPPQEHGGSDG